MSSPVLHDRLSCHPWMDPQRARLPGLSPIKEADWLLRDGRYGEQMASRERLLCDARDDVFQRAPAFEPEADAVSTVLLDCVLRILKADPGFIGAENLSTIATPDGRLIDPDKDHPLVTLGRLVQEDFAILTPEEAGHYRLIAGLICFPASWTLAQKIGRSLTGLHGPVTAYDAGLAARLNRIFAALRPGILVTRANVLIYADPDLYQPRAEGESKPLPAGGPRYVRVERQTLYPVDVPSVGRAIVFSIHTSVVTAARLAAYDPQAFATLRAQRPGLFEDDY
ncbi:MAG: DUF3445 domain-containing protein [Pseudomonadota bacterium]